MSEPVIESVSKPVSEPLRVGLAAEGPTDLVILVAALDAILGEIQPRYLQPQSDALPDGDAGEHGGGWKGVRSWCSEARGNGTWSMALENNHVVVVHVDADIAGDAEINVEKPCPPPADTVDALRPVVAGWIGGPLEPKCVLCVPSKATDVWLVAALGFPAGECDANPAAMLRLVEGKPKPVSGHKPKKHAAGYRRLAPQVGRQWALVRACCAQAEQFHVDTRAAAGLP